MIDILVYLFETYGYADACPDEPEQLARKLSSAGFEEADIAEAIEWLNGLRDESSQKPVENAGTHSIRVFTDHEVASLDVACRGFLMFLSASGVINARQRELIIERAMAMTETEISISDFKVIVLMVLWQEKANVDSLILDELMTEEVDDGEEGWQDAITVH